jgi:hypothetical protein
VQKKDRMAYIGQGIKNGTFAKLDTSGNTYNGSNVTFALGTQVGSPVQLLVSHDGVIQNPGTDYTLASNGTQITFTTAPASGASIFIMEISGAVGGPMNRDINGEELILDVDGDTSITADTDDQIDFKVGGSDIFSLTSSTKVKEAGKETIWIPSAAITPTQSNGCASRTQVETTSGRPDMDVLDFDASSDEHAQFSVAFPKSWNAGTITFQVYWTTTATDTDGVSWGLQGVAVSDNDTIDVAYGTAVVVDDAALSAAEDLCVTAESGAVTVAGSPADNDIVYFRIFRDVSDSNDTAAEDARLIGVKIFFTTDLANDA